MTARTVAAIASAALVLAVSACTSFYEVPIETPIQPKMDVSPFQRVLVAGFLAGGSEDVDANLETVRLLRSQLRSKSGLRVIDADVLPLLELANDGRQGPAPTAPAGTNGELGGGEDASAGTNGGARQSKPARPGGNTSDPQQTTRIKDEKDLEALESIFANVDFWKKLGEEHQNPLIVTGSVLFVPHARSGFVSREQEYFDPFGRRRVVPVRTYMERKGFILRPKFIFIDGRTGTTLYSETFREEILYSPQQSTPALSSYFELMDRLLPSFLSTLSTQKIRGSRILLK
jgi:hypothetical protein